MGNKAILEMVEKSYQGFTPQEREVIGRQVNGMPPRSDKEQELYERYRNGQPDIERYIG